MAVPSLVLMLTGLLAGCGDKGDEPEDVNEIPVANAGANVAGSGTARVNLDGSGSYDPDGDAISYHWAFDHVPPASSLAGNTSVFLNNNTEGASGTSFLPDAAGVYVVRLEVRDAAGQVSLPDYTVVEVEDGSVPVANAGADVEGEVGVAVTLNGGSSYDPLGLDLTYQWVLASVPAGSEATLAGADTATPSLTADVGGVYVAALTVNNGFADSVADAAFVLVSTGDPTAPVAVAGDDIGDGQDCMDLTLDGSASYDLNGDPLGFMWSLQSAPEGSAVDNYTFGDREAATTTFYPDIAGTYVFSLAVNDGSEWSAPDTITAQVAERFANTPPVVDAGLRVEVNAGTALCSPDGPVRWECGSCEGVTVDIGDDVRITDAEGDATTVLWSEVSGNIDFAGPTDEILTSVYLNGASPRVPDECEITEYRVKLQATDCPLETGEDELVIHVSCCGEVYTPDTGT
ncbi:hypothetical protein L6R53_13230 [Myxococcota bacterium]|nr:hypothetical protein [Myxococcota bacterium]